MEKAIFKKVLDIQEEIKPILKDKEYKEGGRTFYKFRGIDDIYNSLQPLFSKHRVFIIPEKISEQRSERTTKSGSLMTLVVMDVRYTLYAEDGSNISGITTGEAMDVSDKASNKAMSTSQKYFLLQTFQIPTNDIDENDKDNTKNDTISDVDMDKIKKELSECKNRKDVVKITKTWDKYVSNKEFRELCLTKINEYPKE